MAEPLGYLNPDGLPEVCADGARLLCPGDCDGEPGGGPCPVPGFEGPPLPPDPSCAFCPWPNPRLRLAANALISSRVELLVFQQFPDTSGGAAWVRHAFTGAYAGKTTSNCLDIGVQASPGVGLVIGQTDLTIGPGTQGQWEPEDITLLAGAFIGTFLSGTPSINPNGDPCGIVSIGPPGLTQTPGGRAVYPCGGVILPANNPPAQPPYLCPIIIDGFSVAWSFDGAFLHQRYTRVVSQNCAGVNPEPERRFDYYCDLVTSFGPFVPCEGAEVACEVAGDGCPGEPAPPPPGFGDPDEPPPPTGPGQPVCPFPCVPISGECFRRVFLQFQCGNNTITPPPEIIPCSAPINPDGSITIPGPSGTRINVCPINGGPVYGPCGPLDGDALCQKYLNPELGGGGGGGGGGAGAQGLAPPAEGTREGDNFGCRGCSE